MDLIYSNYIYLYIMINTWNLYNTDYLQRVIEFQHNSLASLQNGSYIMITGTFCLKAGA